MYKINEKLKPVLIEDIKKPVQGMISARIENADFYETLEKLAEGGYSLNSIEENGKLKAALGFNSYVNLFGTWVKEAFIIKPNGKIYITKDSPILKDPKKALELSKKEREYELTGKQLEKALDNSVELPKNHLTLNANVREHFLEYGIAGFVFGNEENAENYRRILQTKESNLYGLRSFIQGLKIKEIKKPIARQIKFVNSLYHTTNFWSFADDLKNPYQSRGIIYVSSG